MATLATKTLAAINAALEADQGAKFRGILGTVMPLAGDAYSTKEDKFRSHLGASIIGRECAREIWYSFHWATANHFEGRMLRLFNRGHLEEPRFVALLLMIGCEVWQADENGKQFRISGYRGHYGGSLDAVIRGIPDLPDEPVLGEFKTHGDKSFQKLKDDGVMSAKWEHFVQMQQYMGKNNLRYALYLAVNKNDDEIYAELVAFDQQQYERYAQRAAMIIDTKEAPPKINQSPGWFKCKFCDHRGVCHDDSVLPERNCRTCMWSSVADNGEWHCGNPDTRSEADAQGWEDPIAIGKEEQLKGCDRYQVMLTQIKAKP